MTPCVQIEGDGRVTLENNMVCAYALCVLASVMDCNVDRTDARAGQYAQVAPHGVARRGEAAVCWETLVHGAAARVSAASDDFERLRPHIIATEQAISDAQ